METKFIEGPLPDKHRCEFDGYLLNEPQILSIQALAGWHSFYALRSEKKVAKARIHFHVDGPVATSPLKNPFGSFEFSDTFEPRELYEFIRWTELRLSEKGVREILIKAYPALYNARCSAILASFLINHGYSVESADLNACLEVSPTALFEVMSSWEKRKAGELRRSNLRFSTIPVSRLKDTFEFISSSRDEKRSRYSIPYAQVKTMADLFPDKFCLFGLFDNNALAAASVCILMNKSILYSIFSGHSKPYDSMSPMVRLLEGIYEYCQGEKIKLIDLGTSSLNERPNFSALDFKLYVGASPTEKFVFSKKLS